MVVINCFTSASGTDVYSVIINSSQSGLNAALRTIGTGDTVTDIYRKVGVEDAPSMAERYTVTSVHAYCGGVRVFFDQCDEELQISLNLLLYRLLLLGCTDCSITYLYTGGKADIVAIESWDDIVNEFEYRPKAVEADKKYLLTFSDMPKDVFGRLQTLCDCSDKYKSGLADIVCAVLGFTSDVVPEGVIAKTKYKDDRISFYLDTESELWTVALKLLKALKTKGYTHGKITCHACDGVESEHPDIQFILSTTGVTYKEPNESLHK